MGMKMAVFLPGALLCASPVQAQDTPEKALIASGVEAYVNGDATAAMKVWLKGSALEGNTQAMSQANNLHQVEDFYGKPQGFDLIAARTISAHCRLVYFAINYTKGPLFCRFQLFETAPGRWVATEVKFHTEVTNVFPSSMTDPR